MKRVGKAGFQPRVLATICAVACSLIANAQSEDSDIAHARDDFISKVFTKCNVQNYYFGPHPVNRLSCTIPNPTNSVSTAREVLDCAELTEYENLHFASSVTAQLPRTEGVVVALHPEGTLKLPRMRTDPPGVERVLLLVTYTSYRSRMRVTSRPMTSMGRGSQDWESWGRPVPNVAPSTFMNMGANGPVYVLPPRTKAIGLISGKNGQWTLTPGPDFPFQSSVAQMFGRVGLDGGTTGDVLADQTRALGPAAIMIPFPELMADARIIEKIASEKPASCGDIQEHGEPNAAQRQFNDSMKADATAARAAPEFHGSVDDFAQHLPEWVKVFANADGLDPANYSRESAYIAPNIRTCLTITDDMAESVKDRFSGLPVLFKLGKEYRDCAFGMHNVTAVVDPNWRTKKPIMGYYQNPPASGGHRDLADQRWSAGLRIEVFLAGVKPRPDYIVNATIEPLAH